MSLESWEQNSWIERSESSIDEIDQLFQVVDRDLRDASIEGLSADNRFATAYNAARQLCMIPLRASGYRVRKGGSSHHYTILSLEETLGEELKPVGIYLDRCRKLRSQGLYDQVDAVSNDDARDLVKTISELRPKVLEWMRRKHPELLPQRLSP